MRIAKIVRNKSIAGPRRLTRFALALALAIGAAFLGAPGRAAVITPSPSPTPTPPSHTPTPPQAPTRITPPSRVAPRQVPSRESPERESPEREVPERHSTGSSAPGRQAPERVTPVRAQPSRNPHLHATLPQTHAQRAAVRLADDRKAVRDHARHAWHHHWDYVVWLDQYASRGRIVGVVRDASGQAVASARVWLRDARGHVLRSLLDRHITRTNEGGTFVMRHVHRGVYLVRATVPGEVANSERPVVVHPGRVGFAVIHMER